MAATEVLTLLTGNPFFREGIGEFKAKKNEFLVFEEGPSEDVVLQWATYRDASGQCSLAGIWGDIHPPTAAHEVHIAVGNNNETYSMYRAN